MTDEKKALLVSVFFGVIETMLGIIAYVKFSNFLLVISALISIILVFIIAKLYFDYKKAIDLYEYIKFLYFGSEYNGFNLFPKLKLYMDYLNMKNQVEVNTIEFECIDDISTEKTRVQWVIKNIYNNTNEDIKSYYLYTVNEYGSMDHVNIEVKEGLVPLPIDINNIRKRNLIQQTPFTFREPIKPKGTVSEIKINMQMIDGFMKKKQKVVYLYPRNYGTRVEHISITYKIKGTRDVKVILHEIGKVRSGYVDEPIKSCVPKEKNGEQIYYFSLSKDEINVNNLYYLFITER